MIVVLLGAPGCGKTTQGQYIESKFKLPALVWSDILKNAVGAADTENAKEAKQFLQEGEKIPEIIAVELIRERIAHPDCADGFSLEGYPKNMEQAALLDGMLHRMNRAVDVALNLDVQDDTSAEAMEPLLDWYSSADKLCSINGNMYIEEVQASVADVLRSAGLSGAAHPPPMEDTQLSVEAGEAAPDGQMSVEEEAALTKWIDPRRASSSSIGTRTMKYVFTTEHSKEFTSNRRYREDMRRHERVKYDPNEKFEMMMTQSMEYGWRAKDPELYKKDPEMFHPRMKSRETAYSEALILGPRHP